MKKQYIINTNGLEVYYDADVLRQIEKKLGHLKDEKYKVLKNAINATVKKAQADLVDKAQGEYTAKKSPLKKATKIKKASTSKLEGEIDVSGETLELRSFKATAPKSGAKAKVLSSSSLKLIQSQRGSRAKAFLATFASGHTAIVQRQDGESYTHGPSISSRREKWGTGADMTRIKKLLAISFPKMVGGEKVYGALAPSIYDNLQANIKKEIERVVNGK